MILKRTLVKESGTPADLRYEVQGHFWTGISQGELQPATLLIQSLRWDRLAHKVYRNFDLSQKDSIVSWNDRDVRRQLVQPS